MSTTDVLTLITAALAAAAAWGAWAAADRANEISEEQTKLLADQRELTQVQLGIARLQAESADQQVRASLWEHRLTLMESAVELMNAIGHTSIGQHDGSGWQRPFFVVSREFMASRLRLRHLFPTAGGDSLDRLESLACRAGGAHCKYIAATKTNSQAERDDAIQQLEQVQLELHGLRPEIERYFDEAMRIDLKR